MGRNHQVVGGVTPLFWGGLRSKKDGEKTARMMPSKVHHDGPGPMKFWRVYIDRDIGFLALVDVRVRFTKNNLFTSFLFLIMRFGHILRRSERDLQCVFTFLWGRTIFWGKTQTGCWLHPAHVKDSNRLRSWLCTYIVAIASTFGKR